MILPAKHKFLQKQRKWILLLALLLLCLTCCAQAAYRTLRLGDRGSAVRRMQQALNQLGYLSDSVDGAFGANTEAAVRTFQRLNGLTEDGAAGNATLTLLYQLAGQTAATTAPNTAQPSSGVFGGNYDRIDANASSARITQLQQTLNRFGYGLSSDGKYGRQTRQAVRNFQKRNHLTQDGVAGRQTLLCMEQLLGGSTSNTPTVDGFRILRKGDTGSDVQQMQRMLQQAGYYTGQVDGRFGAGTRSAVKAFQRAKGLHVDGAVGSRTYAALQGTAPTETPQPTPTPVPTPAQLPVVTPSTNQVLKKNATGEAVVSLQRALAFLDYKTSTLGVYDNTTVAGVRAFQQKNGLPVDGIAGAATLQCLYSGNAVKGDQGADISLDTGRMDAPDRSQIQLLHWHRDVRPSLRNGQYLLAYDPATGLAWTLRVMSRGAHCDVEPLTAADTAIMYRAFGNQNDWGPKGVYIRLPDGRWTIAGTHNVPHGGQTIRSNNFPGQNCVHFLRTMSEAQRNDPKDGVKNQKCIRKLWKEMTGVEIGEDIR